MTAKRKRVPVGRGERAGGPTGRGERAPARADLPVLGAPPPRRADAARNREKVLAAARRLFAERGVANVTIEEVARAAAVGKGTVFHRFGDRAGLVMALVDDEERALQDRLLRGSPPLGPGAPPADRLLALLDALVDLLERYGDLLRDSEASRAGARYDAGAYAAWHQHAAMLIAEARPDADAPVLAHLLLAPLAAELFTHLTEDEGIDLARLRAALKDLTSRVLADTS
jgi:AcrR family transcriptional regulator